MEHMIAPEEYVGRRVAVERLCDDTTDFTNGDNIYYFWVDRHF